MSRVVSPHLDRPGAEELVDDDLRAVDEVAELRLPEHQRLGRRRAVAVLEARAWPARSAGCCAARAARARRAGAGSARAARRCATSCSTRCRWLKVPRSVSWPVSRIGTPSVRSEASASASACAQSMPPSGPSAARRRSSCLRSLGWTVNPSGQLSSCSLSATQELGARARCPPRAPAPDSLCDGSLGVPRLMLALKPCWMSTSRW